MNVYVKMCCLKYKGRLLVEFAIIRVQSVKMTTKGLIVLNVMQVLKELLHQIIKTNVFV